MCTNKEIQEPVSLIYRNYMQLSSLERLNNLTSLLKPVISTVWGVTLNTFSFKIIQLHIELESII